MISAKKNLKKNAIYTALFLLGLAICIVSVRHWFINNSIIYFVDSLVPLDAKNSFIRIIYGIDSHVYPWNTEANWSWLLYWAIISLGTKIFGTVSLSQMLTYVFLLASSVFGFYLLSNYLMTILFREKASKSVYKIISFMFAIFYTFNLYTFFYAFFMFNPDAFIVAFLPLNLLALFKAYPLKGSDKGNSWWVIIFFATLFLISPGFLTYIFLPQYLIWILVYLIIFLFSSKTKIISSGFLKIIIFLALIFLSIWWWLLPAVLVLKEIYIVQSSTGTIYWFNMGFEPSKLLNSLRLIGTPLMYGNQFSWTHFYIANKIFTLPLFIFPVLLVYFVSSLKYFRNKGVFIYLLIMMMASLFLVKFSNPPFSFITKFAFEHIPFFGAFRDSYHKAGMYYLLPFLLICSFGVGIMTKNLLEKKRKTLLFLFVVFLLVAGVILTGPFFLFSKDNIRMEEFNYANQKHIIRSQTKIPNEYYQLKKVFEPECNGKTVMVVPRGGWVSSAEWKKYNTSYIGVDLLPQLINCSFITTLAYNPKSESSNQAPYIFLQNEDHKGFKEFLFKNQVPFILVRHDNIPFYFSNYLYVDPDITSAWLDRDKDFEKEIINEYFTVYKLKKLNKINTYGFSLSTDITYTESSLLSSTNYTTLSKKTPYILNPIVVNDSNSFKKYNFAVKNYLAIGECEECLGKGEIERLDMGTKTKNMNFKLNIVRNGNYLCDASIYSNGAALTSLIIDGKNIEREDSSSSKVIFLKQGTYEMHIAYTTRVFIDKKDVYVFPEQIVELPIGKDYERNHRLSYLLNNKDQNIEIILSKRKLSQSELKSKTYNNLDTVLVNPGGISEREQVFNNIIQLDELNVNDYYLYIVSGKNGNREEPAVIKNLLLEKAIDTNYIDASCLLKIGNSVDFTSELRVKQISPVKYKVSLPNNFQEGFLAFNKTYNQDWQAYDMDKSKVFSHFQSGYGNAWYVSKSEGKELMISFVRYDLIVKNAIFSLLLFLVLLSCYIKLRK
jgi:hypothetical protein